MENNKFEVQVVYNGVTKALQVNAKQSLVAALKHAINLFSITQAPHLLSLFCEDGAKKDESQSVEDAGIVSGMLLLLRQDAVKGGSS